MPTYITIKSIVLTILSFLIYIPAAKHLHLPAAVPNVFLKSLNLAQSMITTDIVDEEAESFNLGKVCELNWKLVTRNSNIVTSVRYRRLFFVNKTKI